MKILPVVSVNSNYLPLGIRCKASWDYFHPDIPMHIVNLDDWCGYIREIGEEPKYISWQYSAFVGLFYAIQKMMVNKYDLLVFLDADTVVTGICNEMFTDDYMTAVSLNFDDGYVWYNAGVWASRDIEFIKEFWHKHITTHEEDNHLFMNILTNRKDKLKVLDGDGSGVWYNERSREWWNRLEVRDNKLYTPDREVKILHWAGGRHPMTDKMSCSLFSPVVKQWLNKITCGSTFTDYDGKLYGRIITSIYNLGVV